MISVITSYFDRIKSLKLYLETRNLDVQYCLVCWRLTDQEKDLIYGYGLNPINLNQQDNNFNTALCHNIGVAHAKNEWILKQDIDCIPTNDFWKRLHMISLNNFMVVGCDYEGNTDLKYGNEYLVKRKDYIELGGEDSCYEGYFGEDYDFEYRLYKKYYPHFTLGNFTLDNVHRKISDMIVKPENQKARKLGLYFNHLKHARDGKYGYRDNVMNNRKRLYDKVTGAIEW